MLDLRLDRYNSFWNNQSSLGVLLVPVGAVMLLFGVARLARNIGRLPEK